MPKTAKISKRPASWTETLKNTEGLRLTRQRSEVYHVLMETRDHPTAATVYRRAKKRLPSISLATVYNCLEALVEKKLVNQVTFDREPSRYCPNLVDHIHVKDENTGEVLDVTFKEGFCIENALNMPPGTEICGVEVYIRARVPGKDANG